jgi:hypothetical protein
VLLDQNWNPHISDFGLSERAESFPAFFPNKVNTGTSQWMAPELWKKSTKELQKFANHTGPITEKVDVYAFAIILWELNHLGEVLWDGKTANNDIRQSVLIGERPLISDTTPDNFRILINRCWAQFPQDRMSFPSIHKSLEKMKANPNKILYFSDDNNNNHLNPKILKEMLNKTTVKIEPKEESNNMIVEGEEEKDINMNVEGEEVMKDSNNNNNNIDKEKEKEIVKSTKEPKLDSGRIRFEKVIEI